MDYRFEFDFRIAGIPCQIGVFDLGSCDGDLTAEWDVLDRRGRPAAWLANKVDRKTQDQIWDAICEYIAEDNLSIELSNRGL